MSRRVWSVLMCIGLSWGALFGVLQTEAQANVSVENVAVVSQADSAPPHASSRNPVWWQKIGQSAYNNIVAEQRYRLIGNGLKVTLTISVLAALIGTVTGAGICCLRMSSYKILRAFAQGYIALMRGVPVLVMLMIFYYVIFASLPISALMVAVFAFAFNFAGYAAEIFRASIEGIGRGQVEAGIAMGFSRPATFYHIVLPQALVAILPVYKGELISMLKMTSVVGYIAIRDLTSASDLIRSRTFDAFFPLVMVAVLYFLLSWSFSIVLGYFERCVGRHRVGRSGG